MHRNLVIALILAGALIPVCAYIAAIGLVPAISATEALALRDDPANPVVIVDVRDPNDFAKRHIKGSRNWPLADVLISGVAEDLPDWAVSGARAIFLCDSGLDTVWAVQHFHNLSLTDAAMVHDGLASFNVIDGVAIDDEAMAGVYEGTDPLPYKDSPWYEEWSLFLTGYVVKPAYMLLSFILIVILRKRREPDLAALRWGLAFFLFGEAACAVNYIVFAHTSHFSEFLHSYGMVVGFGFMTYAALEGVDNRIVNFSDPAKRCALLPLCPACGKQSGAPCGLRRIFRFLILALIVTALIPFCAPPTMVSYNTKILLTAYNFTHPVIYQIFETRFCPVWAMVLFALSYVALARSKDPAIRLPKILFSAGMGAYTFGMFRLVLFQMFSDNLVWFNSWEEITELLLIAGLALILHIFRRTLFDTNPANAS